MNNMHHGTISLAVMTALAALAAAAALGADVRPIAPVIERPAPPSEPAKPAEPKIPQHAAAVVPDDSASVQASASASAGLSTEGVFSASPSGSPSPNTALSPPVTITYSGGGAALSIADSGNGKGVQSILSNTNNGNAAVFAQTPGKGPGVRGQNVGTTGPGGWFNVSNVNNNQPALFATTKGIGTAILGTITTPSFTFPAIWGQNVLTTGYGWGVEGDGGVLGVFGTSSTGEGVEGYVTTGGTGVFGYAPTGTGVYGYSGDSYGLRGYSGSGWGNYSYSDSSYGTVTESGTGIGLYAYSGSSYGIEAVSNSASSTVYVANDSTGNGINVSTGSGWGIYSQSSTGYAIFGTSTNAFAVIGEDLGSGKGIYGYSATGYAGYFDGPVIATSYTTFSDRNAKTNFRPVDGKDILERVGRLQITSWDFKTDLKNRHMGPMAQDFHAEFGLNGDDDTHINLTDIAGVSLAAVQELNKQMREKDAQITDLKAQLVAQRQAMAEMRSMTEVVAARMTALERQRDVTAQTVALRVPSGARSGTSE